MEKTSFIQFVEDSNGINKNKLNLLKQINNINRIRIYKIKMKIKKIFLINISQKDIK